jgi:hypothetical protein
LFGHQPTLPTNTFPIQDGRTLFVGAYLGVRTIPLSLSPSSGTKLQLLITLVHLCVIRLCSTMPLSSGTRCVQEGAMSPKAKMSSRLFPFLACAVYVHGWCTALPYVGQRDLWMSGLCATRRTSVNSLCQDDQISIFVNFGDAIILYVKLL